MSDKSESLRIQLEAAYQSAQGDVDLAQFIRENNINDDEDLGDCIDLDGRLRKSQGKQSLLPRYLKAIPHLADCQCALDAAVDVSLRSMSDSDQPSEAAVLALLDEYPSFAGAIKVAAMLSDSLSSTSGLIGQVKKRPDLQMPCGFGPKTPQGENRYELRELLGIGSQGNVYLAVDRVLSESDRPAWVAVKLFIARDLDTPLAHLVTEEANKARRINHPNVVRVIDKGNVDEMEYVVHEYIEGGSLETWLAAKSDTPTPAEAADLVMQIAYGIQAAHSAGLAHCDLKPSNVLIDKTGIAKVADFGVARRLAQTSNESEASSGSPIGNLAFLAPELYRRERGAIAPRADVYALGGLLMYLLSGNTPNGVDITHVRRFLEEADKQSDEVRFEVLSHIDPDLSMICRRALSIIPEERYASADALAGDLDSWMRRQPIAWMKPTMSRRLRLRIRREPVPIALGFALVLILLVGATTIIQLKANSRERFLQADIREKQQSLDTTKRLMTAMLEEMDRHQSDNRLTTEALPVLAVLEVFVGPSYLKDPALLSLINEKREYILDRLINENESRNEAGELEWLLAKTAYALVKIRQSEHELAAALLRDDRPKWEAILAPDDPWLKLLDMVSTAALVSGMEPKANSGSLDETDIEQLRIAEQTLKQEDEVFVGMRSASSVHRFILNTLETLYGTDMLDDVDRRLEVMSRRDGLFQTN